MRQKFYMMLMMEISFRRKEDSYLNAFADLKSD